MWYFSENLFYVMQMSCILFWHMTIHNSFLFLVDILPLYIFLMSVVIQNKGNWIVLRHILNRMKDFFSMKSHFCVLKKKYLSVSWLGNSSSGRFFSWFPVNLWPNLNPSELVGAFAVTLMCSESGPWAPDYVSVVQLINSWDVLFLSGICFLY